MLGDAHLVIVWVHVLVVVGAAEGGAYAGHLDAFDRVNAALRGKEVAENADGGISIVREDGWGCKINGSSKRGSNRGLLGALAVI